MQNISYFCIVKRFNSFFRAYLMAFLLSLTCNAVNAQPVSEEILQSMDSVNVSLLTCGPGHEVWSLYGHTAIRYNDIGRHQDLVINYGMFSFRQKFFILRFVFGLTDYEMGIMAYNDFISEYQSEGRWVKQQTLNLTRDEKWAITQAIDENYRPENRTYRYNYFYDNCTTRARDMITSHINGNVLYAENQTKGMTFRNMIHAYNGDHPWARLGNDLLLGVKADAEASSEEQQFLPDNLCKAFDDALIINKDGKRRQLVGVSTYLLNAPAQVSESGIPVTPADCSIILLIITIVICLIEWIFKKVLWGYDAILLTLTGLAGIILFAMIFSQHPTVSLNFQILILCPLSLIFAFPVVKKLRKHEIHWYLKVLKYLIATAVILFAFQKYDQSVLILALILLGRIVSDEILCTKKLGKQ